MPTAKPTTRKAKRRPIKGGGVGSPLAAVASMAGRTLLDRIKNGANSAAPKTVQKSPFTRRALEGKLPAKDLTNFGAKAGKGAAKPSGGPSARAMERANSNASFKRTSSPSTTRGKKSVSRPAPTKTTRPRVSTPTTKTVTDQRKTGSISTFNVAKFRR